MKEITLLCRSCRHIFKASPRSGPSNNEKINCPRCDSQDVVDTPAWAPLGSGMNIFDSDEWEYECQDCHRKFKMPIPKSPTEEKERGCPQCSNKHLHRLTQMGGQPLYCG
jgi:DNA-directed RNA polymerase subunit RPC12/RpoP